MDNSSYRRDMGDGMDSPDSSSLQNVPSQFNLETLYRDNIRYATQRVLPPSDFHSPYYLPFNNIDDPRPVDQLIYRLTIWKMIIKQVIFYFQEMSIFKKQTFLANRAMLETLEILKRQNSGKLKNKAHSNKGLKKSMSSVSAEDINQKTPGSGPYGDLSASSIVNKLLQTTFLPPGDHSILSISNTYFDSHNAVKERELVTYQQLSNKLIPKLENLKEQLNGVIEQMTSLKSNQGFKTKNLKMEIAKTGAILSDYLNNIELFTKGETKTRLGTTIKLGDSNVTPKDPYLLKLKLDLQLKDQLYSEARLKDMYYDLQKKAVQLEKILYLEIQNCIGTYTDLIDCELNAVKDNMIQPFRDGFLKNSPVMDWDFFIRNDKNRNFLNVSGEETLKTKVIRKTSDIVYPYRQSSISSCLLSGFLDRKSKYLKNYSKFYYVLTLNYLHEFKSNDRKKERHPTHSFPIDDIKVSVVDDDPKKFVLRIAKKDDNSKAKSTFRCETEEVAKKWVEYLCDLTDFDTPIERNNSYEDEEDEEEAEINGFDTNNEPKANLSPVNTANETHSIYSVPSTTSVSSPSLGGAPIPQTAFYHARIPSDHSLDNYFPPVNSGTPKFPSATNITFRSIKSTNAMMPSAATRYPATGSKSSSKASSRATSPTTSRFNYSSPRLNAMASTPTNINNNLSNEAGTPGLPSPTPLSPQSGSLGSTINNGDYFSFRSNVRTLKRLPSGGSSGSKVTTNSGPNSINSPTGLNTNLSNNSLPIINVISSPVNEYFNINDIGNGGTDVGEENNALEEESGMDKRRRTLTEQLKKNSNEKLLPLPGKPSIDFTLQSRNNNRTIPATPGVIPGSRLDGMFNIEENDEHDDDHHE